MQIIFDAIYLSTQDSLCNRSLTNHSQPLDSPLPRLHLASRIVWAAVAVSVEALVFIVIGRSCSEGCRFDSYYRPGSFWELTEIRGAASVGHETVADSRNVGYVWKRWHNCYTNSSTHHTTVAIWARYAMWFTRFEEKGTLISSASKLSCRNSGDDLYDTITTGPR